MILCCLAAIALPRAFMPIKRFTLHIFMHPCVTSGTCTALISDRIAPGWLESAWRRFAVIFKTGTFALHKLLTIWSRSEEHTSELQSQSNLVCRLLLEKKKK